MISHMFLLSSLFTPVLVSMPEAIWDTHSLLPMYRSIVGAMKPLRPQIGSFAWEGGVRRPKNLLWLGIRSMTYRL